MCLIYKYPIIFFVAVLSSYDSTTCDPITNSNFNSHLRDYAAADTSNVTNVETLQKEDLGRHANFAPADSNIKFKETSDSALLGTSNSRGLLYHDQPGYTLNDYDEGYHFAYGHDYHYPHDTPEIHSQHGYEHGYRDHHSPHGYDNHHYSGQHHLEHGHYNKHYKHALAAKTVLWPIAGIALLGAAAALISNPVLLQLGVVSGKRRRRDTEEITGPDFPTYTLTNIAEKNKILNDVTKNIELNENLGSNTKLSNGTKDIFKRRALKAKPYLGKRKVSFAVKSNLNQVTKPSGHHQSNDDDDRFIPIPIKLRYP